MTAEHGPMTLVMLSACFGLATGLIELVLHELPVVLRPRDAARGSHGQPPLPLDDPRRPCAVLRHCGLFLAAAARVWPNAVRRIAAYVLCGLAALELLLILPGLYGLTYALLACGFASLLAPRLDARLRRLRLNARRMPTALVGVLVVLAGYSHRHDLW